MRRWKSTVITTSGRLATIDAAEISPQGSSCSDEKRLIATGTVWCSGDERKVSHQKDKNKEVAPRERGGGRTIYHPEKAVEVQGDKRHVRKSARGARSATSLDDATTEKK